MAESQLRPDVLAFLEGMRVPCVLATLRRDGAPITSATWYGVVDGQVVISTPAGGNKARNAKKDQRVSVIVDRKERPYAGVAIEGAAEVLDDDDGAMLTAIIERYLGPQPQEEIRARLASRGDRVILRITAERVRQWGVLDDGAYSVSDSRSASISGEPSPRDRR